MDRLSQVGIFADAFTGVTVSLVGSGEIEPDRTMIDSVPRRLRIAPFGSSDHMQALGLVGTRPSDHVTVVAGQRRGKVARLGGTR